MKTFIVFFISLLPVYVPSEEPILNLVAIDGYRAVSSEESMEVYSRASYYFREVGVGFRLKVFNVESNPCWQYHSWMPSVQVKELGCLKEHARQNGLRRKKMLTYYMLPPSISVQNDYGPQTAWIGGLAEWLCGKVAMGNATPTSLRDGVEGESRIDHSATILAHEVGHMLCAEHIDTSPNLMHSSANIYTSEYGGRLPVLNTTKRQIKRGYAKWRKL